MHRLYYCASVVQRYANAFGSPFIASPLPVQIVVKLVDSSQTHVVMFAGMCAFHLAALPGLREPLGEAGAVEALMGVVRR